MAFLYSARAAMDQISADAPAFDRIKAVTFSMVAFLLIVAAYFSPHIWQHGEAREALVIRDIVNHHRWVLPLRNSELPSKPILYHWMGAAFSELIGLSDFTIRLPSVVAAAFLAWMTYALGTFAETRKTGLLAVGILASMFEFWDSGTEARVDMLFAALIGAAVASWYLWYRSGREFARAGTYLSAALAVLTKGPAGFVIPALIIVCFLALAGDLRSLFKFFSWPWVLIAVGIVAGWYLAAYQHGGTAFWHKQIIYENVDRFLGEGKFQTRQSFFSQAFWLLTRLFPWSVALVLPLARWIRGQRQDSFGRFLHTWWLGIFLFFVFAAGHRAIYLLPIYPAVALLAARECVAFLDSGRKIFGNPRTPISRWVTSVVVLMTIDAALAAAIPISRTVREDSNDQEEFVEDLVPKIPPTAAVYAALGFPETARIVLAYRLKRDIPLRALMKCDEEYYYLTQGQTGASCAPNNPTTMSASRDGTLQLLHVSTVSR
jgi:4-amino-4-deoxy-L-arabinose transferase-like glycosyltransferase